MKWLIHSVALCLSVDAEGGVALVTLAGEISYQLTIADHQKQAATYGTAKKSRGLKRTELIKLNAITAENCFT